MVLGSQLAAWEQRRNDEGATVKWMFDVDAARTKLKRAYPNPSPSL